MRLGLHSGSTHVRPVYTPPTYSRGLGDVAGDQQAVGIATSLATTTVGILTALHSVVFGLAFTGPVGAIIGGAIAGLAAVATVLIKDFSGCGQTCVIASQDANKYGDMMTQNLQAYLSSPIHYASLQTAGLNNYDALWAVLSQACSDPSLGVAGQNCIGDRQAGACKWKSSPGGWSQVNGLWHYTAPGPAGSGDTCWNYFVGMRDPIANDPSVVPDPIPGGLNNVTTQTSTTTSSAGSLLDSSSGSTTPILIVLAAIFAMGTLGLVDSKD